jgi:voltage-dependent calcium channel T type alpha-1G
VETLVTDECFDRVIIFIIVINTLFLASEHYEQVSGLGKASEIANYIFTVIFFLEMVLKLFGLGIKKYTQDGFNVFDAIIVLVSLVELF